MMTYICDQCTTYEACMIDFDAQTWCSSCWNTAAERSAQSGDLAPFCVNIPFVMVYCRRSEEHTSELQSHHDLVCRLLLEKKKTDERVRRACDEPPPICEASFPTKAHRTTLGLPLCRPIAHPRGGRLSTSTAAERAASGRARGGSRAAGGECVLGETVAVFQHAQVWLGEVGCGAGGGAADPVTGASRGAEPIGLALCLFFF